MNKKIILLILLSMMLALLTGCKETPPKEAELVKVTNVYRSVDIKMPENFYVNTSTLTMNSDGRISVMCTEILDMETYETATLMYSFDINGENIETEYLTIDHLVSDDSLTTAIHTYLESSEGNKIYYIMQYNMETNETYRFFDIYDADDNLLLSVDPKQYFNTLPDSTRFGMDPNYDYFNINQLKIASDDTIYMASENAVVAVDVKGTKLFEVEIGSSYIDKLVTTNDGKVVLSYNDDHTYQRMTRFIDPQKKAFGDDLQLPGTFSRNNTIYMGAGYDMYYSDRVNLYGCNTGAEPVQLMNFINSDINPQSMQDLYIIDENLFLTNGYDYLTGHQQFSILTRVPDDEVVPKILINMSFLYIDTYVITPHVINFNRTNDVYRIVMNDYSIYNTDTDWEAGRTKFNLDIMSDNIPDIIVFDSNMTVNDYLNKGLLSDLNILMDNDPGFDKNNIMQCVRNAYEVDGKMYQMPTKFNIQTLTGYTSIVGEKEGWTIDEITALMEKYPDSALTSNANKQNIMNLLMTMGFYDFIDYEKNTCSFDSEEFIKLLNYANSFSEKSLIENMSEDDRMDFWENEKFYFQDNRILLRETYIHAFDNFLSIKMTYNNEPFTLKGYPSANSNGGVISANGIYTISDKSLCKDGAWEFLKVILSDEVMVSDRMGYNGFPVTISGFDKASESMKKYHYYMNENGTGYSMSEEPRNDEYVTGIHMQVTDEDINKIKNYINNITVKMDYTNQIYEIIADDIQMFLAGEKSAEETAKVIQSRALMYISEKS